MNVNGLISLAIHDSSSSPSNIPRSFKKTLSSLISFPSDFSIVLITSVCRFPLQQLKNVLYLLINTNGSSSPFQLPVKFRERSSTSAVIKTSELMICIVTVASPLFTTCVINASQVLLSTSFRNELSLFSLPYYLLPYSYCTDSPYEAMLSTLRSTTSHQRLICLIQTPSFVYCP